MRDVNVRGCEGRSWEEVFLVLCRHGLNEEVQKVIPKVAEASAGSIAGLKGKVDHSLITDICLAKVKQQEEEIGKQKEENDKLEEKKEELAKKVLNRSSKRKRK